MPGQERVYRKLIGTEGLVTFGLAVKETDLLISASRRLEDEARTAVLTQRRYLEDRIAAQPEFLSSLTPLEPDPLAPSIVREMLAAAEIAGTGPMAAVAGAVAGQVGAALREHCQEVIVENGGDLYLDTGRELTVALFAGDSPLSGKLALKIPAQDQPLGVSTSSGTVGHSLSLGRVDAATVKARSPALADALATALGNRVADGGDIEAALTWLSKRPGALGGVVIVGRAMGAWGAMELIRV